MARVWVTRAQPGADATAARLRAMGLTPLVAPLLEVVVTVHAAPDLAGVGAIAFSSANGVAAFAGLSSEREIPAYAVGEATAEAARGAGFATVTSADGDVAALARMIVTERPRGAVLHVCPDEPAGDLAGALSDRGVEARRAALYATLAVEALPPAVVAARNDLDGVLLHSPKAARTLARLSADHAWLKALIPYALSETCAAPLRAAGFAPPRVAPFPREEALLMLVPDGSGDSSGA